jgi:tRNA (cytidine/uridine-2'-O-)-methyltransferase
MQTATEDGQAFEKQDQPWLNVVLFEPEIALNTGTIGRSCLAMAAKLWLVRPLGFRLDEKNLKRSGLDYWKDVDVEVVDDYAAALAAIGETRTWLMTTKGQMHHWDACYETGDTLVFGPESRGLPGWLLETRPRADWLRIPMMGETRSLNLANAATVAMYEAARQIRPEGLMKAEFRRSMPI